MSAQNELSFLQNELSGGVGRRGGPGGCPPCPNTPHPVLGQAENRKLPKAESAPAPRSRVRVQDVSVPAQNKKNKNSGNELNDLLQTRDLAEMSPQNELVFTQNEVSGNVSGPARPADEVTPHPSCSGWRKRRSTPPSSPRERAIVSYAQPLRVGKRGKMLTPFPPNAIFRERTQRFVANT